MMMFLPVLAVSPRSSPPGTFRAEDTRNVPGGDEGGETDVFADYSYMCSFLTASSSVRS